MATGTVRTIDEFWAAFKERPAEQHDLILSLRESDTALSLPRIVTVLMGCLHWDPSASVAAGVPRVAEVVLLDSVLSRLTTKIRATPAGNISGDFAGCIWRVLWHFRTSTVLPDDIENYRAKVVPFLATCLATKLWEESAAQAAIQLNQFHLLPLHYLPTLYGLLSDWMVKKGLSRLERLSCRGWARWLRDGEQVPEGLPKDVRRAIVARNRTFRRCIMRARPRVAADQRRMFRACALWDSADMPSATDESARPWLLAKTMLAWLLRIEQGFHNLGIPAN